MQYEILDENGVIFSFTDKHEADHAWDAIVMNDEEGLKIYSKDHWAALREKYATVWRGDLKLVQVHRIYK